MIFIRTRKKLHKFRERSKKASERETGAFDYNEVALRQSTEVNSPKANKIERGDFRAQYCKPNTKVDLKNCA